jgi:hypothetical protein
MYACMYVGMCILLLLLLLLLCIRSAYRLRDRNVHGRRHLLDQEWIGGEYYDGP